MKQNLLHLAGLAIAVTLFSLALWVLHHELHDHTYQEIAREFSAIPWSKIVLASFLTFASYLVLTFYDVLAISYIGENLAYWQTAMASFVGYTLSHNLGFSILTGGAARYRLFSLWGLTNPQIARAIAYSGLIFWLGFSLLGGAVWFFYPLPPIAHTIGFTQSLHIFGALLFIATLLFVALWLSRKHPLKIKEWEFPAPKIPTLVSSLFIAAVDWTIAATVTYSLLPACPFSLPQFVGIFQLSQIIGLLSHVPGGLGVFESVMVLAFSPAVSAESLLGALFVYRIVYYIVPLILSASMLAIHEIVHQRETVLHVAKRVQKKLMGVIPSVLTIATFLCGIVLLLSDATPAIPSRISLLIDIVPLPLIELSHFLGSMAGMALLLLARGLQRRLDGAYFLTLIVLCLGVVVSLLKGIDYEEGVILALCFICLLPCRQYFYRKSGLLSEPLSAEWMAAMGLVVVATVWLVFFAHKHIEYSHELWWQFSLSGDAPRALRALVGVACSVILWFLLRFLSTRPAEPSQPSSEDLQACSLLVEQSERTYPNLALVGDKALLFNSQKSACVMFGTEGRSYVALGDPFGNEKDFPDLVWDFRELSDRHGGYTVFYQVHPAKLPLYVDIGLSVLKLGEEALVPLSNFTLEGRTKSSLRHTRNRIQKEKFSFRIASVAEVEQRMSDLRTVSDDWLAGKNTREKGFSLGYFETNYLKRFPTAFIEGEAGIVAFANLWCGANKEELSVDLMRYSKHAPAGVMEYLFLELMLWGKSEGYRFFNLGMAPLSGFEDHDLAPLWHRVGSALFRHGENFYNFQGLRQYKEKFEPVWEARYLASPGGIRLPHILTNLATLISGGMKGLFSK